MKTGRPNGVEDDVVVLISAREGGLGECVIRRTDKTVKLGDQIYRRYRIVKPRGFEKEEILHPLDQGTERLLSTVFTTLAFGGRRRWKDSLGIGE